MRVRTIAMIGSCAVLTIGLSVFAWAEGGGADKLPEPPRAPSSGANGAPNANANMTGGDAGKTGVSANAGALFEYVRLVEKMQDARIDAKNLPAARAALGTHWRKMRAPWFSLPATDAGKLVTSIALRTSATEVQWAAPTSSGNAWKPEARVWNMNEGSYDQRESIAAPTPATITFKIDVPEGAIFEFAPGSVNATGEACEFSVFVTDARGERKKAGGVRLPPELTRKWGQETRVDLSAYTGQTIDLELVTEAVPKSASETLPTKPQGGRRDADAGPPSDETPVTPGATLVALWGNPTILKRDADTARVPYNVLFVVIDALRPDVIASFHDDADDAAKAHARVKPQESALPKVPGLMPAIDGLAKKGVVFQHAYSGGAWTRPGTLSMLSGARSSELGVQTLPWVLPDSEVAKFYAGKPPLLPVLLRDAGVTTRAFVNNYFMVGYAPVGVDMGFSRVDDHRYRTKDTDEITKDAIAWMKANADDRFFAFVNYNSPHEPWEPPARFLPRVPEAPEGPSDRITRLYMAEAAKDDEAIEKLLATLDDLKIADHTIVVVTADHGETLSASHTGVGLDKMQIRYHHAVSNYEETTRIPILIYAPGALPEGAVVKERVRNTDIAPTLVELLSLPANATTARMTGKSLVDLAKGQKEADPRVVVSEGRGTRAILWDHYRLILRDARNMGPKEIPEELFDLTDDPGERNNLASKQRDVVAEMRARLDAAQKNVPAAGTHEAKGETEPANKDDAGAVHIRFAGGGAAHRISGKISSKADLVATPVGFGADALKQTDHDGTHEIEIAALTVSDAAVGIDLAVKPPGSPVSWQFYFDDAPIPDTRVFAGPYGIVAKDIALGLTTEDARTKAQAEEMPLIDPHRDFGLFVTRERHGAQVLSGRDELTGAGAEEMNRLLKEWGYAH